MTITKKVVALTAAGVLGAAGIATNPTLFEMPAATVASTTPQKIPGLMSRIVWSYEDTELLLDWGIQDPSSTNPEDVVYLPMPNPDDKVLWTIVLVYKPGIASANFITKTSFPPSVTSATDTHFTITKDQLYCAQEIIAIFYVDTANKHTAYLKRRADRPIQDTSRCE